MSGRFVSAMEQKRAQPDEFKSATEPRERLLANLERKLDEYVRTREQLEALGGSVSEEDTDLKKYEMLIKVTKYSIDQIKAAHT